MLNTKINCYFCYIMNLKHLLFILLFILVCSCKNEKTNSVQPQTTGSTLSLRYAKGFQVTDYNSYKILEINQPWPNAQKTYRYALLKTNHDAKFWATEKTKFDGVFNIPIKKIIVTSTTHISSLDLLNQTETLVGFPGTNFISSKKVRTRINKGLVRELGVNESLNTEVVLELKPDLVVGFGINGNNRTFDILKKATIPIIYNGDWVENSPLAKAEWLKFFGTLFNTEKQADSIFNTIKKNYLQVKELAKHATKRPSVLSGAMHKDIWYLPNGASTEAQLLKDANANYLWKNTLGTGSLSLSFESVFTKAKDADIWLSPSNYTSMAALKEANIQHSMFKAFKTKNIYSFIEKTGETGGVIYFEEGTSRPDLVLKDLIKICHPELLEDYDLYFFKHLN